ncbi:MAG: hypothetical protein FJ161_03425, partial [Gammaproteobacteria bacterium]|nr:hypothetical protein [Gammaproteobacteria bacterium]
MSPVSYDDVCQAIEALLSENQSLTLANLREALGHRGSMSTLSKHLQTWKQQKFLSDKTVTVTAPPAPDSIFSAVQTVWQQMQGLGLQQVQEKEQEIQRLQANYRAQSDAHQSERKQQDEKYHALMAEYQTSLAHNQSLEQEHESLFQQYEQLSNKLANALSAIQGHSADMTSLLEVHANAQKQIAEKFEELSATWLQYQQEQESRHQVECQHILKKYEETLAQLQKLQTHCAKIEQEQKQQQSLVES